MEYTLFDYGVGNLHSLHKAIEALGREVHVTRNPGILEACDVAVLPGVGAFGHVMESLDGGVAGLRKRHRDGRPILGICIGMQILYEGSAEADDVEGLGILEGRVERLSKDAGKVPHMGWNTIHAEDGPLAAHDGQHVYYVHSYAAPLGGHATATTTYGGEFAAAVRRDNTFGFQFHPEKSSTIGRAILAEALDAIEEAT